jgi:4-hydroxybenzoate polyprenyltransferase
LPRSGQVSGRSPAGAEDAVAFAAFCAVASGDYLFKDIRDRELDRQHPTKRDRPPASGELAPAVAAGTSVALYGLAIGLAGLAVMGCAVNEISAVLAGATVVGTTPAVIARG